MEEVLTKIFNKLESLELGQQELKQSGQALKQGQQELKQSVQTLEKGQQALEQGQQELRQSVRTLEQGQQALEQGQQELRQSVRALEQGQQELKTSVCRVETRVEKLELRLENEVINKIGALFNGYSLRGDQIERLQKHLDERLDRIESDTRYLVTRVARLEQLVK